MFPDKTGQTWAANDRKKEKLQNSSKLKGEAMLIQDNQRSSVQKDKLLTAKSSLPEIKDRGTDTCQQSKRKSALNDISLKREAINKT